MKNTKQIEQQVNDTIDLLDVLLDRENHDPIILQDETGRTLTFEQVAVIPYDVKGQDRLLYVILKPLDIAGIADDEAVVFRTDMDKHGHTVLKLEEDEPRAKEVFEKFYELLEEISVEEQKKGKKK